MSTPLFSVPPFPFERDRRQQKNNPFVVYLALFCCFPAVMKPSRVSPRPKEKEEGGIFAVMPWRAPVCVCRHEVNTGSLSPFLLSLHFLFCQRTIATKAGPSRSISTSEPSLPPSFLCGARATAEVQHVHHRHGRRSQDLVSSVWPLPLALLRLLVLHPVRCVCVERVGGKDKYRVWKRK